MKIIDELGDKSTRVQAQRKEPKRMVRGKRNKAQHLEILDRFEDVSIGKEITFAEVVAGDAEC